METPNAADCETATNASHRTRLRPQWTIATMLFILTWSSLAIWLNIRSRHTENAPGSLSFEEVIALADSHKELFPVEHGYPWTYARGVNCATWTGPSTIQPAHIGEWYYRALAGDILVSLIAIAVLTCLSAHLLRLLTPRFSRRGSNVDA